MGSEKVVKEVVNFPLADGLEDEQIQILDCVRERKNHEQILEGVDVSQGTLYSILDGLYGKKQGVPKKWRVDKPLLKLVSDNSQNSIKYELNHRGWKVLFATGSLSKSCNEGSEDQSRPEQDGLLRPHYLRSKHLVKGVGCGEDRDSWFVRLRSFFPETEDGSGVEVYWNDMRAEVYRDSVQLRIDMEMDRCSVEEMFSRYMERRDKFLRHVEDRLQSVCGVRINVVSEPELVDCSMVTQEWALVENSFAEYVDENRELFEGERSPGNLFEVSDEKGDTIATVDCSTGVPEFEWVDSQEAKNHVQNMEDLILWGATNEITPKDFRNLAWLRDNFDTFDTIYDRLLEFDSFQEEVESLGRRVGVVEDQVEALAGQQQRNRELIVDSVSEQNDKIRDAVERVEGVQNQLNNTKEDVKDAVEMVDDKIQSNRKVIHGLSDNVKANQDMINSLGVVIGSNQDHISSLVSSVEDVSETASNNSKSVSVVAQGIKSNQDVIGELAELKKDDVREKELMREELEEIKKNTMGYKVNSFVESVKDKFSSVKSRLF